MTIGLRILLIVAIGFPINTLHGGSQIGIDGSSGIDYLGDACSVAGDPHNITTLYVATGGRGVFKSTDDGETWKSSSAGMPAHAVLRRVIVDPQDPTIVYTKSDTAIFKSVNAGESWFPVTPNLSGGFLYGLAIDPSNPSILYVGVGHKIFQTTDRGKTWRPITAELGSFQVGLLVDPKRPQVIYALSDRLRMSMDAGRNWRYIDSKLPKGELDTISLDPSDSSVLYIGTEKHGIYKSTDSGKHWRQLTKGLFTKTVFDIQNQIPPVRAFAIDPIVPSTLYAGVSAKVIAGPYAAVFKSMDAGRTWKLLKVIGAAKGSTNVCSLAVAPFAHNVIFAGTEGDGIFKSVDGGMNWSGEDAWLTTGDIVKLAIGKRESTLYAATIEGVYKFDRDRWEQIGFRHKDFGGEWMANLAVDPTNSETVYVGTRSSDVSGYGGVFKSTDGGRTWSAADSGLRNSAVWVSALEIDPIHSLNLYAGTNGYGIFKTSDGGATWIAANSGISRSELSLVALTIDPTNSATVYAATPGFVWKSEDHGAHWSASKGLPPPADASWRSRLTSLVIDRVNPATLYAAHLSLLPNWQTGVYTSNDGGANWVLTANAAGKLINYLAIDPAEPKTIYTDNGDNGILKSTDSGRNWTAMNSGLPTPIKPAIGSPSKTVVTGLVVDPNHAGTIYISTRGRGVFKSSDGGAHWGPLPSR